MATRAATVFDPARFASFRFVERSLDPDGHVVLRYALDDAVDFVEEFDLPVAAPLAPEQIERAQSLLALLHWVAGVSYFKTAAPPTVLCEDGAPPPAAAALLEALYSEGLGEFAYTNRLPGLPRPRFPHAAAAAEPPAARSGRPARVLVPIGGGKDSIVALETIRRSGRELALFSIGTTGPIGRTAAVAALPHLVARRRLDPQLRGLNAAGALNGHVPITAIVSCAAVLTASLRGFDVVAMANERSASTGNLHWDGVEVNHQFSKSLRAERLLSAALRELGVGTRTFSILRPASELAIARAFSRLTGYHDAFTSCNAVFALEGAATSWCCNCPKCRFVFLMLAPFSEPEHLRGVFGSDLLDDEAQLAGFAALAAVGAHKPFECVGEEAETVAAIRMLAVDPRWSEHRVVRRLVAEVLPQSPPGPGDPSEALALGGDHDVPPDFLADLRALLGS